MISLAWNFYLIKSCRYETVAKELWDDKQNTKTTSKEIIKIKVYKEREESTDKKKRNLDKTQAVKTEFKKNCQGIIYINVREFELSYMEL